MGAERLILGTAQFGLSYGISNNTGRVATDDVAAILSLARAAGVASLDTAAGYGDSESVLGSMSDAAHFAITTKTVSTGAAKLTPENIAKVEKGFHGSLARLRRQSVDALLVHNARDLLAEGGERLWDLLQGFRSDGKVRRVGVSVYDGREVDAVIAKFPIDVVQLPVNALDQRLLLSGSLAKLRSKGISVQARSAFLQGLLLMPAADIARRLPRATSAIKRWNAVCESAGTTPLAAALAFVLAQPEIDHVVIGVHSRDQLAECLTAMEAPVPLSWEMTACDDLEVIDPRRWTA